MHTTWLERWPRSTTRTPRLRPISNIDLPSRHVEARDHRISPGSAALDDVETLLPDHNTGSTEDESSRPQRTLISRGWSKALRFTPPRWIKPLRFIRIASMGPSWNWNINLSNWLNVSPSGSNEDEPGFYPAKRLGIRLRTTFAILLLAWDVFRILHGLYQRPPGFHIEFTLFLELCICAACLLDWTIDLPHFGTYHLAAYHALWNLPAALVSVCIAWRHVWRYPSRRRERIRYATIKPQLAFTASGKPVAVYPPQDAYGLVDVRRLSIDSLQEDRDWQSSGNRHRRHINEDLMGYQQTSASVAL